MLCRESLGAEVGKSVPDFSHMAKSAEKETEEWASVRREDIAGGRKGTMAGDYGPRDRDGDSARCSGKGRGSHRGGAGPVPRRAVLFREEDPQGRSLRRIQATETFLSRKTCQVLASTYKYLLVLRCPEVTVEVF